MLLRLCVSNGNETLKKHLEGCSANATYTSQRAQNEIMSACNSIVLQTLVSKVNAAKCFAVMADETTDIAGVKQLLLCARYMDMEQIIIKDEFLSCCPAAGCILVRLGSV